MPWGKLWPWRRLFLFMHLFRKNHGSIPGLSNKAAAVSSENSTQVENVKWYQFWPLFCVIRKECYSSSLYCRWKMNSLLLPEFQRMQNTLAKSSYLLFHVWIKTSPAFRATDYILLYFKESKRPDRKTTTHSLKLLLEWKYEKGSYAHKWVIKFN